MWTDQTKDSAFGQNYELALRKTITEKSLSLRKRINTLCYASLVILYLLSFGDLYVGIYSELPIILEHELHYFNPALSKISVEMAANDDLILYQKYFVYLFLSTMTCFTCSILFFFVPNLKVEKPKVKFEYFGQLIFYFSLSLICISFLFAIESGYSAEVRFPFRSNPRSGEFFFGRETILFLVVFYISSNLFLMLRIVLDQIIQKRRLGR